ncbi:iron-sulfur cluster loop [Thioalkalivibrio sp. XN8]|uniref:endonuclease III domain-containing protein n=1 Tax=Thioalkalivibrio sp. XN8 TaxID=2712863 RepID=UPI0013E9F893|nr:iron-sulfur cluster loop [Thioalkalivibrio sp. XN8]NGP51977.1 iron-sulfur cluster loop [Thioalkalivibrio sp. XN8]
MTEAPAAKISRLLIQRGRKLFRGPSQNLESTGNANADRMVNDLDRQPHAFVIACIMSRQMRAERCWIIPYEFKHRVGTFDMKRLRRLSDAEVLDAFSRPTPLHRYNAEMARNFQFAIQLIAAKYRGDASRIWANEPSSAELVYRFLEFRGVGPKIATMAANILARQFKVPLRDYYSIDVSADVHVKRVFERLGLVGPNADVNQVIFRARSLSPEFPGLLDFPAWEIGRHWCRPRRSDCASCYMRKVCPTAASGSLDTGVVRMD